MNFVEELHNERMEWTELKQEVVERKEAIVVKFEMKDDEFIGKYIEKVSYNNKMTGEPEHFWKFVDIEDSEKEYILFPTSVLNTKLNMVKEGQIIKIVYDGLKPSEKNKAFSYKDFKIYTASE